MRIAVAGTHRIGKTTLAEAFVAAKPEYLLEPEPYVALIDERGEEFIDDIGFESFERQLRHHRDRVAALAAERNVMFDRCAADLLAYMKTAVRILGDGTLPEDAVALAQEALAGIDLIVHLPLRSSRGFVVDVVDADDASHRREVDGHLAAILEKDELGLFGGSSAPHVLTLGGPTARSLKRLLAVVDRYEHGGAPMF